MKKVFWVISLEISKTSSVVSESLETVNICAFHMRH